MLRTPSRPDLTGYRESLMLPFPRLVAELVQVIGKKLTAYIGGAKDVRAVDRWMDGGEAYKDAGDRLRLAYRLVHLLNTKDHPHVIQAWLTGLNPELSDRAPVRLLRDGNLDEVGAQLIGAARAFTVSG